MNDGYDGCENIPESLSGPSEYGSPWAGVAKHSGAGRCEAVADGLLKLRQLTLRRAARLHRHATGVPVPPGR